MVCSARNLYSRRLLPSLSRFDLAGFLLDEAVGEGAFTHDGSPIGDRRHANRPLRRGRRRPPRRTRPARGRQQRRWPNAGRDTAARAWRRVTVPRQSRTQPALTPDSLEPARRRSRPQRPSSRGRGRSGSSACEGSGDRPAAACAAASCRAHESILQQLLTPPPERMRRLLFRGSCPFERRRGSARRTLAGGTIPSRVDAWRERRSRRRFDAVLAGLGEPADRVQLSAGARPAGTRR